MRHYLINKKFIFVLLDFFLAFLPRKTSLDGEKKRVLLSNIAHIGDVVIATSMIPLIKEAFPGCKIGFLVSSATKCVIEKHPMIDWIHVVDHWKLNRAPITFWKKLTIYWKTKKRALQAIRKNGYDIAIDLYYYFPNSIPTFWQADIPVRVGFTSGGFGPLLTHPVDWENRRQYVPFYYQKLFPYCKSNFLPSLPLKKGFSLEKKYILIHPTCGYPLREWPRDNWRQLSEKLSQAGFFLVFTGKGERERKEIEYIAPKEALNLCDRLNWQEYVAAINGAELIISGETAAMHIARAFSKKMVIFFCGITDPKHWAPPEGKVLFKNMRCVPCLRKKGCKEMRCIRDVSVEEAYTTVLSTSPYSDSGEQDRENGLHLQNEALSPPASSPGCSS